MLNSSIIFVEYSITNVHLKLFEHRNKHIYLHTIYSALNIILIMIIIVFFLLNTDVQKYQEYTNINNNNSTAKL